MLILSRKIGESIVVGDDITVTLVAVQGLQAKIGIDAPRSIEVDRKEIRQRKDIERGNGE